MSLILGLAGLAVVGGIIAFFSFLHRGRHQTDLGTLSPQWMAEQRQTHQNDSNR